MIVVDASYINKKFDQIGTLGKGKDILLGIPSSIFLLERKPSKKKKNKEEGLYALQIYENLGPENFEFKVNQLQKAMINHVNSFNTRVIMLAKQEPVPNKIDLYVLFEMGSFNQDNLTTLADWEDALDEEKATHLLRTLCLNYQM